MPGLTLAAAEAKLADTEHELVDVTVKMPAKLRDHLASICQRHDLKLDDIVSEQIKRWLLGQTIALLEGSGEEEKEPAGGRPPEG
ncbi:MAG TPA: hypothetical protein VF886_04290 [Roseiarcus sp.]|jgi:hypothetical protein